MEIDTYANQIDLEKDDYDDNESADILLAVDMKYCTICHVEQPLRTKHCKHCD
jgi:hypothetical protein